MARYKNETGETVEITLYGLRVENGQTFDVPDEDLSFEARPGFTASQRKTADVAPDPALVDAATAAPASVPAEPLPSN